MTPDSSEYSDEDLVEMMAWDSTDPAIARAAWGEFFTRYKKRVFWLCRGYHDPWNVVGEVFRRAKEAANGFDVGPVRNEHDQGKKQYILLAWLGSIARSIACDQYRRRFAARPGSHAGNGAG